jgi:Zinc finger, C3HC4 type (RING finger)
MTTHRGGGGGGCCLDSFPATLVVFQGVPGDGIRNTIDTAPEYCYSEEDDDSNTSNDDDDDNEEELGRFPMAAASESTTPPSSALPPSPPLPTTSLLGLMSPPPPPPHLSGAAAASGIRTAAAARTPTAATIIPRHRVVGGGGETLPAAGAAAAVGRGGEEESAATAIERWNEACRRRETAQRQEWIEAALDCPWLFPPSSLAAAAEEEAVAATGSSTVSPSSQQQQHRSVIVPLQLRCNSVPWWIDAATGNLAVFDDLPRPQQQLQQHQPPQQTPLAGVSVPASPPVRSRRHKSLPPGAVVTATELVTLRSTDFAVRNNAIDGSSSVESSNNHHPTATANGGRQQQHQPALAGVVQFLRIDANAATGATANDAEANSRETAAADASVRHRSSHYYYVVYSVDGYTFLGGWEEEETKTTSAAAHPNPHPSHSSLEQRHDWWWRVTCVEGAYVRTGLDLTSQHVHTLPYGALVRVVRRTINSMALSRLQIAYRHDPADDPAGSNPTDSSSTEHRGWISEFLNPLSGQRGTIAHPLPFPRPGRYRVVLPEGATIRNNVELSSATIGTADCGAVVRITGRTYSEQPADRCIVRYRITGHGGWISGRLNGMQDDAVIQWLEFDPDFDPNHPGRYHLECMRRLMLLSRPATTQTSRRQPQQQQPQTQLLLQQQHNGLPQQERASHDTNASTISSIGDDDDDDDEQLLSVTSREDGNRAAAPPGCTYTLPPPLVVQQQQQQQNQQQQKRSSTRTQHGSTSGSGTNADDPCLICLCEERTATIVHGDTGHVACCLVCARILKARGDCCPCCRLPIDRVIQHFWA